MNENIHPLIKMKPQYVWSKSRYRKERTEKNEKYLPIGDSNKLKIASRPKKCITEITREENRHAQNSSFFKLSKTVRKETSSERKKMMSGVNMSKTRDTKNETENTRILNDNDTRISLNIAQNATTRNEISDVFLMVEGKKIEKEKFHSQNGEVDIIENKMAGKKTGRGICCLLDFIREDINLQRVFSKDRETPGILLRRYSLPQKEKRDSKIENVSGEKRRDGHLYGRHSILFTLVSIITIFIVAVCYLHKERAVVTVTKCCIENGKQCRCMRCCEEVPISDNEQFFRKLGLATYCDIADCVDIDIGEREDGGGLIDWCLTAYQQRGHLRPKDGRGDDSYSVLDCEDEANRRSRIVLCRGTGLLYHTVCGVCMLCAGMPLLHEYERIINTYDRIMHEKPDNRSNGVYHKARGPNCKVRVCNHVLNNNSTKTLQRKYLADHYFKNNTLMTQKQKETREFSVMCFIRNVAVLYIILMWVKENRNILSKDVSSLPKETFPLKSYFDLHRNIPNVNVLAYPASRGPVDAILTKYFTPNPPTKSEVMAQEMLRICTLHDFPKKSGQSCIRLAQAGFFYEGIDDELVCFSCGVRIRDWTPSHKPLERHRQMSGQCMFILEHTNISNDSETGAESVVSGADSAGYGSASGSTTLSSDQNPSTTTPGKQEKYSVENHGDTAHRDGNGSCPSGNKNVSDGGIECPNAHGSLKNNEKYRNDVAQPLDTPVSQNERKNYTSCSTNRTQAHYPEYVLVADRLQSFNRGWPSHIAQTPQVMAESGFYYAGYDDCVRCFQCGIGLRNWEPPDNPDVEHARWSPKCPFLLKTKGQDFINLVLDAVAQLEHRTEDTAASTSSDGYSALDSHCKSEGRNNGSKVPKEGQVQSATDPPQKAPIVSSIVVDSSRAGHQQARGASGHSAAPEVSELKNKNRELREMTVCKICLEEEVSIVFLPCGHLVACAMCAPALSRCAVCRKPITGTVAAKLDI